MADYALSENDMKVLRVRSAKKEELRLEQECLSIKDRVEDLEWRIEGADDISAENLMNERQRALDKLRETRRELFLVREQLVDMGVR